MLESLTIRNLALLEEACFTPASGLTVISGETGGGKTLVVRALRLLRGERGRAGLVRKGAVAATIDGVFRLSEGERSGRVRALHEEILGLPPEDDRILISRVLDPKGRGRARISGRPVGLSDLQRIGAWCIEIHGQGANKSLMRPEIQTEMVDAFGGLGKARREFAILLEEARKLERDLSHRLGLESTRRERRAFLRFCLAEIDELDPVEGELDDLRAEVRRLEHLDRLRETIGQGLADLHEGSPERPEPVVEELARVSRAIRGLVELDPSLENAASSLEDSVTLVEDAARELQAGLARLDIDPGLLEERRARLEAWERLCERFGPGESEVLSARERMRAELRELEDPERSEDRLRAALDEKLRACEEKGRLLTRGRKRAAKALERLMVRELSELGMSGVEVEFRVVEKTGGSLLEHANELGTSEIRIFLAPNPGEPPAPLSESASGGEVARTMLAFKKILADADRVPVLVFDEIESEIGARLGLEVGKKMRILGRSHQVICVTHLPQVAAFGDSHWLVRKEVEGKGARARTRSLLRPIEGEARRLELAQMAVGQAAVDEGALAEAGRLLQRARSRRASSLESSGSA